MRFDFPPLQIAVGLSVRSAECGVPSGLLMHHGQPAIGYGFQGNNPFLTRAADELFNNAEFAGDPSFWLFFAAWVVASTAPSVF